MYHDYKWQNKQKILDFPKLSHTNVLCQTNKWHAGNGLCIITGKPAYELSHDPETRACIPL